MNSNPIEAMRTTHHIVIGIDKEHADLTNVESAYEELKVEISRHSGGITAFKCEGIWFPSYELGDLSDDVEHDITLNFLVTLTMEEELYGVWETIKKKIAHTVNAYDLGVKHIHCTAWWSLARHFRADCVAISNNREIPHCDQEIA